MLLTVSMRLTNEVGHCGHVNYFKELAEVASEWDFCSRFCDVRDSEYLFDSVVKTIWQPWEG